MHLVIRDLAFAVDKVLNNGLVLCIELQHFASV